jgi:hypothetical protein
MEQQAALAAALILHQALALEIPQALRHLKEITAAQALITFLPFALAAVAAALLLLALPQAELLVAEETEQHRLFPVLLLLMRAAVVAAHRRELLLLAALVVVALAVLAQEELLELPILVAVVVGLGQAAQVPAPLAAQAAPASSFSNTPSPSNLS